MAAQIPIKNDPAANEAALDKVRAGQAARGHATATTARGSRIPAWCRSRRRSSTSTCRTPNQFARQRADVQRHARRTCSRPRRSAITEAGLRNNIHVGIQYLGAWLGGNGCVPIYNLMEDAATAEISRSQIWQWIRSPKGVLDDGRKVTLGACSASC